MSAKAEQKASPAKDAKKSTKKKAAASKSKHPPYKQMIIDAIVHLKDPNGVSRKAIRKYIEDKHSPKNVSAFLGKSLRKMVESGKLKHPKKYPGKYVINIEKADKKQKKSVKKGDAKKQKVERKPKKDAAEKKKKSAAKKGRKVKSAKRPPVRKVGPKKVKGPPSPKKSAAKQKKGRGRPKKK